jgi:carbamoyltransferase
VGIILGLGGPYYHDASAALVVDGQIAAFAEEERFSRRKHHKDSRSCATAAAFCLAHAGLRLADVDEIGIAFNPAWPKPADTCQDADLIAELLDPAAFDGHRPKQVRVVEHHLAHAASAFYPSGFPDAAVLVVDGSGDGTSATIAHGTPAGIETLRTFPFTQSLGWFYETVAEHLGLGDWTSSGKLMGLAAYGKPRVPLHFLTPQPGGYRLDLSRYGLRPHEPVDDQYTDLRYYQRLKRAYAAAYTDLGIPAHRRARRWDPATGRAVEDPGYLPAHADLAASAQQRLEECLIELADAALAATGTRRLCLAGGVALNCSANGRIAALPEVDELFVHPAAGDAGCGLGAALHLALQRGDLAVPAPPQRSAALGPEFNAASVRAVLDAYHLPYLEPADLPAQLAEQLADGAVAGWFQGRMEAGPRALGQRSILADPRHRATRDRINDTIKNREPWRPLAPALLTDAAPQLLGTTTEHPFMIVARPATDRAREAIPAAVHIDGTVRPQTVAPDRHDPYAALLAAFAEHTDAPAALLNTSFNHEAEPIVCTPRDAVRTFAASPLDVLAIGPFLAYKSDLQRDRHTG